MDEDGFLRQRGAEIFEYNSKGQSSSFGPLTQDGSNSDGRVPCSLGFDAPFFGLGRLVRVYSKASSWTIQYRYDGLGRRVASKNSLGQHLQFFYADLNYPTRITHVYNHSSSEITSFYYDFQVGALKTS